LEFSPHTSQTSEIAPEKVGCSSVRRSMPVHEMPPQAASLENQSTFCEFNDGIPKQVASLYIVRLLADLGEKKAFLTALF
jgi:hypothetical protein